MTADDVLDLYFSFDGMNIPVWIDGGWGVDALLGEQTRPHKDLDIAIEQRHVPRLRELLGPRGYGHVPTNDHSAWNFVLGDHRGRRVDVHVIVLDENGDGIYGPASNGQKYPASSLTGRGCIAGKIVRCIAAKDAVQFHTGYALKPSDVHDVTLLCRRFGLELPEEYQGRRE